MFNENQIIQMRLVRPDADLAIKLRYPADDQWKLRQEKKKLLVTDLGRGKTREEDLGKSADLDLIQGCIEGDPVELLESEASRIVSTLSDVAVVAMDRTGSSYHFEIEDFGDQAHEFDIKVPTSDQLEVYRRDLVRDRNVGPNKRSITINLAAVEKLWVDLEGPPWLPLPWRSVVLRRLLEAVQDLAVVRENPL